MFGRFPFYIFIIFKVLFFFFFLAECGGDWILSNIETETAVERTAFKCFVYFLAQQNAFIKYIDWRRGKRTRTNASNWVSVALDFKTICIEQLQFFTVRHRDRHSRPIWFTHFRHFLRTFICTENGLICWSRKYSLKLVYTLYYHYIIITSIEYGYSRADYAIYSNDRRNIPADCIIIISSSISGWQKSRIKIFTRRKESITKYVILVLDSNHIDVC